MLLINCLYMRLPLTNLYFWLPQISIPKGKNGFGFTFVGELPPKVGRVDRASPAEQAGIKKGDLVIKVNGQNVSRSSCEGVAHLVK